MPKSRLVREITKSHKSFAPQRQLLIPIKQARYGSRLRDWFSMRHTKPRFVPQSSIQNALGIGTFT